MSDTKTEEFWSEINARMKYEKEQKNALETPKKSSKKCKHLSISPVDHLFFNWKCNKCSVKKRKAKSYER